jgi:hypothetical protein
MTKREDLREEWLAMAELRLMKVEEIRDLLSISSAASVEEVLRITKWWQDNLDGSIPTKLKSQAHRLLSEIHSLNEANLKILDELRTVAPATASLLRYRYDAIAPTMRETNWAGDQRPCAKLRVSCPSLASL